VISLANILSFAGSADAKERSTGVRVSLLSKASWSVVAAFCAILGRFVTGVLIARILGPSEAGRLAFFLWVVEAVSACVNLGQQSSLTRFQAQLYGEGKAEVAGALARWIYKRYLGLSAVGALVIGLVFWNSEKGNGWVWLLTGCLFVAQGLGNVYQASLDGRQCFAAKARLNFCSNVLLVIGVAVGALYFGLVGVLGGYLLSALVPGVLSVTLLRQEFHEFPPKEMPVPEELRRAVWRYAIPTWVASLTTAIVWSRMEVFFLNRFWDSREIALFTVGLTLASMATQGPLMFLGAFMPHFAERHGAHDLAGIQRAYRTGTRFMAFLLFPLSFGGAVVTPVLLPLLYGPAFAPGVNTAMVLMAGSAVSFISIGSALIYGLNRSSFHAWVGGAGAVLSVAGGLVVVPLWGAFGAACSRVVVQGLITVCTMVFIARGLRCGTPLRDLARIGLAALACAGSAGIVLHFLPTAIGLVLAIGLGGLVYGVGCRWLGVVRVEDLDVFKRVLGRLPGWVRLFLPQTGNHE
jgi:O-antigen/teichoic acid export membrane protein